MTPTTWCAAVLGEWSRSDMMGGSAGWHWAWMLAGLLVAVALIVATASLAASAVRAPAIGPAPPAGSTDRARAILAERLARGELTPAEYRERLRALG